MAQKRVLVVEDDEDVYDFLRPLLEEKGFIVDVAIDGRSGIKKVREFQPDLVVLDLMMTGLDGYGFLRGLRAAELMPSPKVLVLTAVQKVGGAEEALKLGAHAFLIKPVDNKMLWEKIQALI
jgi:two-component system, OmpR family, copper resistance phosphate regulon response regulator CusR